jgi:signal peptidase I
MKRVLRRCFLLVAWVILGAFGGLVLAVGLPNAFHAKSLTVMSGSMEPTIGTGDVVVARQTAPMDVRVGDVVTFRDPLDHERLITHRVREMHVEGDSVVFVTKGDANTGVEHWALGKDGTIGRVAFHVPKMGYFMVWFHSRYGLLILIVLPSLLLGMSELWRLWRPHGKHEPGAAGRPRTQEPTERQEAEPAERPVPPARERRRGLPDEAVA